MLKYPSFVKEKWNIGNVVEGMILRGWLHGLISDIEQHVTIISLWRQFANRV